MTRSRLIPVELTETENSIIAASLLYCRTTLIGTSEGRMPALSTLIRAEDSGDLLALLKKMQASTIKSLMGVDGCEL